jgi:hypothetical protein
LTRSQETDERETDVSSRKSSTHFCNKILWTGAWPPPAIFPPVFPEISVEVTGAIMKSGKFIMGISPALICTSLVLLCIAVRPGLAQDLTLSSSPAATPSTAIQGRTVQLSAYTMKNSGTAAAGPFAIGYYLSKDSTIASRETGFVKG